MCACASSNTDKHPLLLLLCCGLQTAGAASAQAQYAATELRKLGADAITLKARARCAGRKRVGNVHFEAADKSGI
jgi:hypothetical protein